MPRVLVPLPPGFEEIEAVTVVDILRRAEIDVLVAGTETGPVTGGHGISVIPDRTLQAVADQPFDMIVLPGGAAGTAYLRGDLRIAALLRRQAERGAYIAAICAAPTVLADLGLLAGKRVTSYPTYHEEFSASDYRPERVVIDERIVTSRSPGTALEFALALVEVLKGRDESRRIGRQVLAPGTDDAA